jgi:hypothetical protein
MVLSFFYANWIKKRAFSQKFSLQECKLGLIDTPLISSFNSRFMGFWPETERKF